MNTTPFKEQDPLDGVTWHKVAYRSKQTERLPLNRLSLRKLYQWGRHFAAGEMPELVALCADKPVEWVDTLADESFADLANACLTASFGRVTDLAKGDPVMAALITPRLVEMGQATAIAESHARAWESTLAQGGAVAAGIGEVLAAAKAPAPEPAPPAPLEAA